MLFRSLNVARPPQGHPLIIQAGSSEAGQDLAAATADVVFTGQLNLEGAQRFYRSLKGRMARLGRSPDSLRVMPGLVPIVGRTHAEAREKFDAIQNLIDSEEALTAVHEELVDRFGLPPEPVKSLLETHRLRVAAKPIGIARIDAGPAHMNLH